MKNKIIIGILFIIIVVGVVITSICGLNFDLIYSDHKEIDIYIGKEFNNQDIYQIVQEVIGKQRTSIQKVELYEDMVSIKIKDITDEQIQNINTKINEKYEIENKVEDIVVTSVPKVKEIDLVKPYILPLIISFVIFIIDIVIYNSIYAHKGRKVNTLKETSKAAIIIIGVQLLYLSIIAITRLPVNHFTMPISIAIYIISTIVILICLERKYAKIEE